MKRYIRIIASLLCITVTTVLLLSLASFVVSRKDSVNKNTAFFTEETAYDAFFMGSSHMLNAALPMELWEQYGITSYNFSGHGCRIPTSYWIMRNALDYQKPKVMVIDCYYLSVDIKHDDFKEFVHMSLDAFPLTATKLQAINDLFETDEDRMAFVWPFSTYHNRWKELTKSDLQVDVSPEKGANIRIGYKCLTKPESIPEGEKFVGESQGTTYLRKMITLCKEQGIDVVLTYVPFSAAPWAQREANRVHDIAEEFGVQYFGYEELRQCIDFNLDFSDDGHLNYSGGAKITSYIGKILSEKYNLEDKRSNEDYSCWNDATQKYKSFKASLLNEQKYVALFMPLLYDRSANFAALYNGQSDLAEIRVILQGLGVPENLLQEGHTFLAYFDREEQTVNVLLDGDSCETQYGKLECSIIEEGCCTVSLDGKELFSMNTDDDVSLWVNVWDDAALNTICSAVFNKNGER